MLNELQPNTLTKKDERGSHRRTRGGRIPVQESTFTKLLQEPCWSSTTGAVGSSRQSPSTMNLYSQVPVRRVRLMRKKVSPVSLNYLLSFSRICHFFQLPLISTSFGISLPSGVHTKHVSSVAQGPKWQFPQSEQIVPDIIELPTFQYDEKQRYPHFKNCLSNSPPTVKHRVKGDPISRSPLARRLCFCI